MAHELYMCGSVVSTVVEVITSVVFQAIPSGDTPCTYVVGDPLTHHNPRVSPPFAPGTGGLHSFTTKPRHLPPRHECPRRCPFAVCVLCCVSTCEEAQRDRLTEWPQMSSKRIWQGISIYP